MYPLASTCDSVLARAKDACYFSLHLELRAEISRCENTIELGHFRVPRTSLFKTSTEFNLHGNESAGKHIFTKVKNGFAQRLILTLRGKGQIGNGLEEFHRKK